jgi:ornithine decarboxylase
MAAAAGLIRAWGLSDTFYVYDLGEVARLHALWVAAMPRVAPFYAVKCNPEPGIVAMLDALGAGFDCASVQELERAAALGVPQSRVIFANPCKRPADFRYAAEKGSE